MRRSPLAPLRFHWPSDSEAYDPGLDWHGGCELDQTEGERWSLAEALETPAV